jgi:hypothetical protein
LIIAWPVLLVLLVVTGSCSARSAATDRVFSPADSDVPRHSSQIDDRLRNTKANEFIRVIVQLRLPTGTEATREQRIKSVQDSLLAELSSAPHKLLRAYSVTPALALEVSPQALSLLRHSPYVLSIEEDTLSRPFVESG